MIEQGFFGKTDINEWLVYSYNIQKRTIQELTDLLNNRILTKTLVELNPDKEFTFNIDTLREYIIDTTLNKTDKINPNVFKAGKAIVKEYNINPFNISGYLITKSQLTAHLYDCLGLEPRQKPQQNPTSTGQSIQKSALYAYKILNQALTRAQKKGFLKKTQRFEIYVYDEETMERKRVEDFYDTDE